MLPGFGKLLYPSKKWFHIFGQRRRAMTREGGGLGDTIAVSNLGNSKLKMTISEIAGLHVLPLPPIP